MAGDMTPRTFDYGALDPDAREAVRNATEDIHRRITRAGEDIVAVGQRLIEVKQQLAHGQFGQWLEAEFQWSERAARRMMDVATTFKTANLAEMEIAPSALYLLAQDSTPEPVRREFLEQAERGQPVTHKAVKEAVEKAKPAKPKPQPAPEPTDPTPVQVTRAPAPLPDDEPQPDPFPPRREDAPPAPPLPPRQPWEDYNAEIAAIADDLRNVRDRVDRLAQAEGETGVFAGWIDRKGMRDFFDKTVMQFQVRLVERFATEKEKQRLPGRRPFVYIEDTKTTLKPKPAKRRSILV